MYEWVDHTSELELRIEADSERAVFQDGLSALGELLDSERGGRPARRDVVAEGSDRAGLLAAWLEEIVFLAESEGFVPRRATEVDIGEARVEGALEGFMGDPRHLVKAVTYHRLSFERTDGRWRATVVLDV